MKKLLALVLLISLTGCALSTVKTPFNLSYDTEKITWTSDSEVTHYKIKINGEETVIYDDYFLLSNLKNGSYTIAVKAYNGNQSSSYSKAIKLSLDRPYDIPTNLRINNVHLVFDAVDTAISYDLYVDGIFYKNSQSTVIPVDELTKGSVYKLQVKAIYSDGSSDFSITVPLFRFDQTVNPYSINLKSNQSYDYYIPLNGFEPLYVIFDHQLLHPSFYYIKDDYLYFDASLIKLDETGQVRIELYQENARVDYHLNFSIPSIPYIATLSTQTFKGEDLVFYFELLGGNIRQVIGGSSTHTDYTINGEVLTLKASFFNQLKANNPSQSSVILTYELFKDGNSYIGTLTIKL